MPFPLFDQSIFKKYFDNDDTEALTWAENVLTKLQAKGIVPDYISRDGDFDQVFEPVCIFFSYLVKLARVFETFTDDQALSNEYVLQKGQYTCGDESLDHLLYLIENLLRIRAQRGTISMIEISEDVDVPHGELLRLICLEDGDYFKLGVARPERNGWNVNNSGPLGKGCTGRLDLNSAWEYTKEVVDLSLYPLIQDQYISIGQYRGRDCMHIESVPFAQVSGIGEVDLDKVIPVNPNINFEITFEVAQDITLENISFGCIALDSNGDQVELQDIVTGNGRQFFFETRRLNKAGKFYQVRGIIYSDSHELLSEENAKLNIGFGRNLRFTETVRSIIPVIIVDNNFGDDSEMESDAFDSDSTSIDAGDSFFDSDESWQDSPYDLEPSVYLYNIKVNPCSTVYNRSYLNNKNLIDIFMTNNNGQYSVTQLNSIFRKYFIPYNTAFQINNITEQGIVVNGFLLLEDGNYILYEDNGRIVLE